MKLQKLSFSGSGFLLSYHFGVIHKLRSCHALAPEFIAAGSSGGSIAAVLAVGGIDAVESQRLVVSVAHELSKFPTQGFMRLETALNATLPPFIDSQGSDFFQRCQERAFIKVSWAKLGGDLISSFDSNSDLCEAVVTSCHIPL